MNEDIHEHEHRHNATHEHGPAGWHGEHMARGRWPEHGPGRGWPGFFGPGGPGGHRGGRDRFWNNFGGPGGPGGPGGFGGHGGGRERMERGMLRYVLLDVLQNGPMHGYEIIKQLEEKTQGRYSPSPGTLYPTLQYLEDLVLVTSTQEEGRRVYSLTDAGRAELSDHAGVVDRFWSPFRGQKPSGAAMHEIGFLRDALVDLNRTVSMTLRHSIVNGDPETIKRARLALERCQNEIRSIVAAGPQAPEQPQSGEPTKPVSAESGERQF